MVNVGYNSQLSFVRLHACKLMKVQCSTIQASKFRLLYVVFSGLCDCFCQMHEYRQHAYSATCDYSNSVYDVIASCMLLDCG